MRKHGRGKETGKSRIGNRGLEGGVGKNKYGEGKR